MAGGYQPHPFKGQCNEVSEHINVTAWNTHPITPTEKICLCKKYVKKTTKKTHTQKD